MKNRMISNAQNRKRDVKRDERDNESHLGRNITPLCKLIEKMLKGPSIISKFKGICRNKLNKTKTRKLYGLTKILSASSLKTQNISLGKLGHH